MSAGAGGRVRTLAFVIALLLIGNAAVVGVRLGHAGRGRDAEPAPAQAGALQSTLPELIAFVEHERGLTFKQAPTVELLSDKDFEALLKQDDQATDAGDQGLDAYAKVLQAFGLVGGNVDFTAVTDDEIASTVGFYDSRTKKLYARGVDPTPYVRMVLVHELTHALDDQYFNIDREDLDDEADAAFTALVEGNAVRVEQRWVDSRPKSERDAIEAEDAAGGSGARDAPDVFEELFAFPYVVGPGFVQALLDAGGQAKLDDAFVHPPTTTEQVLHPQKFLAGEGARAVAAPQPDGPVVDQGVNGELGLILVLDSAVDRNTALRAAAGWGGDSYVAWTSGNRTCFRWNIVMDDTRDANEAVSALRSWAGANRGATVRGTNPIVVANCA